MESHIPPHAKTGRPRYYDRKIINGIIHVLTTGCRWDDMPKRYGDDSTANRRLNKWQQKGIWKRFYHVLFTQHINLAKLIYKKYQLTLHPFLIKKGQCNWI